MKRNPLVVGSVSVGIGPQKNPPDVCHVVHAYCGAFEDVTAEKENKTINNVYRMKGREE